MTKNDYRGNPIDTFRFGVEREGQAWTSSRSAAGRRRLPLQRQSTEGCLARRYRVAKTGCWVLMDPAPSPAAICMIGHLLAFLHRFRRPLLVATLVVLAGSVLAGVWAGL
jgi:hypothetical protein